MQPIIKVGLSSSPNPLYNHFDRHTWSCVSMVILNLAKGTMKINRTENCDLSLLRLEHLRFLRKEKNHK